VEGREREEEEEEEEEEANARRSATEAIVSCFRAQEEQ